MNLWIRSQDKEDLIKVCSLEVASRSNDKYTILTLINSSTVVDLGIYETKERAIEVLDEIQDFLERKDYEGNRYYEDSIYEMPKK